MNILEEGMGELIQPPDMEAFREWNRDHKTRAMVDKLMSEQEAVQRFVYDGCYLGTELYGTVRAPMSLTREVIRQRPKNLRLLGQGVLETEYLLAAGIIEAADITYFGLEVYGVSNVARREIDSGRLKRMVEWSNSALTWRMKAAAMGVPFLPARTMLGTDTFRYSAAKVVLDPFTNARVCVVPALVMDVVLIHVHRADRFGNAQIDGISGFACEAARAAKRVILSAEEIIDTEQIRQQPDRTLIPYFLVDAVVHAPFGSYPGEMVYLYGRDEDEIRRWVKMSETVEDTAAYLEETIYGLPNHQAFLETIGEKRMEELRLMARRHR
ncbi:MAG: CoA transferase subunit A [Anaerolineales bacterium]|nr:CoA transferase subunit A [Anaerolineales bacterium]